MFRYFSIVLLLPILTGCMITDTAVTNPVPGLSTVAVAPFINTSMERGVDGRRFANFYFTELQKVPGFEVVPVGVVETAMAENKIEMRGPADAARLAEILHVDAIVVGAVTDYESYAPPRVGLKVSWYSAQNQTFLPGIPIDPLAKERLSNEQELREIALREANRRPLNTCCDGGCGCEGVCDGSCENCLECEKCRKDGCQDGFCPDCDGSSPMWWRRFKNELKDPLELHKGPRPYKHRLPVPWPSVRAQSPEAEPTSGPNLNQTLDKAVSNQPLSLVNQTQNTESQPVEIPPQTILEREPQFVTPPYSNGPAEMVQDAVVYGEVRPFMEYVRMFDAKDPEVAAKFRDYLELSGAVQTGHWDSYLHRTDEYIQFVSHVMIKEMLQLHGGESRRRIIFAKRKYN